MFSFYEELIDEIEINGKTYSLNLFFDTVLLFFDLMNDDSFFDYEKVEIAFQMFINSDEEFDFETKYKVVEEITKRFIIGSENDDTDHSQSSSEGKKYYCLKQDAEFIYASFMQEYGIDLIEQQGKLRWEKFKALLIGLRDNTKFKEVVGIRAMELPKGKGTEKERRRIMKLKRIYALKQDQKDQEDKMQAMFDMLAGKTGGK